SAALTALALFSAYASAVGLRAEGLNIIDPAVTIGLLIGGTIPFFIAALTMTAVGRAAAGMVEEVRRQFREIPGLMEGTARPDSARCVDISTRAALREMIVPGIVAVSVPVIVGYISIPALGGVLAGATVSGVLMALFMANSGGAWDNAKKYIEQGAHGGKGSEPHKAAVVGDTVGDPFKDTSGPSMNILIKLMSVVSLVLAPWFARVHGLVGEGQTSGVFESVRQLLSALLGSGRSDGGVRSRKARHTAGPSHSGPSPPWGNMSDVSFERALEFARDLIRIPGLPGAEGEVAARVRAELEHLGFD